MGADAELLGGTAIKPKGWDRTGLEAFRYFLYDPDTGAILSRTPESWAKITAFYLVYYACLSAFWLACLNIFFLTLPDNGPKWTLEKSIVSNNPGVGVRPYNNDLRIDSSMFVFYSQEKQDKDYRRDSIGEGDKNMDYAIRTDKVLAPYNKTYGLKECTNATNTVKGKCIFELKNLGDKCSTYPYNYFTNEGEKTMSPCIYLKLNKIYNWEPKPIKVAELEAPKYDHMPARVKDLIKADNTNVYMDCQGRNPADKETVKFTYHPANQGIPMKYFPFTVGASSEAYHAPMVAVQVESKTGQMVHVECKAWYAKTDEEDGLVEHNSKDKIGLAQFELLVR